MTQKVITQLGNDNIMVEAQTLRTLIVPLVAARVYNDASIDIVTATTTTLTFNAEYTDTEDIHSILANTERLTAPQSGFYIIGGSVVWEANATGRRLLFIRQDGATTLDQTSMNAIAGGALKAAQSICTGAELAATEYVELLVRQESGGNLEVEYQSAYSPVFWMVRQA